jgi:hypothetical protein
VPNRVSSVKPASEGSGDELEVGDEFGNPDTWRDVADAFRARRILDAIAASVPLENANWSVDERTEILRVLSGGRRSRFATGALNWQTIASAPRFSRTA